MASMRTRFFWSFAIAGLASLLTIPGCGRTPVPTPALHTANLPKAETRSTYRIVGVVRSVDRAAGEVMIEHEEVPGYMPAMTMPFAVKDRALLDDVRPGDEVEGSLLVRDHESELIDLAVTRPALPEPMVLDLSGGTAKLQPKPKVLEPGQPVPDFAMITQEGQPLRLSDLRGEVVVLTFIYTRCPLPEFCPRMDRKFAELADKIASVPRRAKQVRLLSVSFDPEHDTPEVLRRHARAQGAGPPLWTFAVAAHEELAKVAAPLGLTYGPTENQIIHNLIVAVIDQEGKLVRLATGAKGKTWSPDDFFKTISSLLPKTSTADQGKIR
jgi:protein SCO1/2